MESDNSNNNQHEDENPPVRTIPTIDSRGYCNLNRFAALMSVEYRTARQWLAEGRVKHIRIGREIRILEEEIRYILEHGTRPKGSFEPNK